MARFNIKSKDGADVRYSGEPQYEGSYMGVSTLEFSNVSSPVLIKWEVGDYVDYYRNGMRYTLRSIPEPTKQARPGEYGAAFVYESVVFYAETKDLEIALFRDLVTEDNLIHFSSRPEVATYEDVYGIARRIQECLDDLYPGKWTIRVVDTEDESLLSLLKEPKSFSVSDGTCLDALAAIYDTWKGIGWTHEYDSVSGKNYITIGGANERTGQNTSDAFAYGKDKGLTSIKKGAANEGEFATRLYVYGSERNIPPKYYNSLPIKDAESVHIPNLMLPIQDWGVTDALPDPRKAFIQADDAIIAKYGLIPRTIRFDGSEREEIYPSIEGLTEEEVREAMIALGQGDSEYLPYEVDWRIDEVVRAFNPEDNGATIAPDGKPIAEELPATFRLIINSIGFDPMKQAALANETNAVLSMKSGTCAGREFPIVSATWDTGTWYLELERQVDDSLNIAFPNKDYPIAKGDRFVMLDIAMPQYYVLLAEKRMHDEAMKVLADYTRVSAFYEPVIDPIKAKKEGWILREGMFMKVYDEDIVDTESKYDYVLIDSITINEASELPIYTVTLSEQKRAAGAISTLEGMVEDAKDIAKGEAKRSKQYTERRFSSLQETISMLEGAFKDFTPGITPSDVQTMMLVAGDARCQFRFTASRDSLDPIPCPIYYDASTKRMIADASALVHFTLGIDSVTAPNTRTAGDYLSWNLNADSSEFLDDTEKSYYVCVQARKDGTDAYLYLTENPIDLEVDGYYYFYVGILNSESGGTRDFATIYGFTEVAPGRIVTNVIRSADGTCVFDLENNTITGPMKFLPGTSGIENIDGLSDVIQESVGGLEFGKYNLIRNSGFTGDFVTESLDGSKMLDAEMRLFSDPFRHWMHVNATIVDSEVSQSGKMCTIIDNGVISQSLDTKIIKGENYVLSFRAKGVQMTYSVAGVSKTLALTEEWTRYVEKFTALSEASSFTVSQARCDICEIQLERGNVVSAWGHSMKDNQSELAKYQSMQYLEAALAKGSTDILGGLIFSNLLLLGNEGKDDNTAGVSGIYEGDDDVAFWGGGTYAQAITTAIKYAEDPTYQPTDEEVALMAKAVITHGGRAILNDVILRGTIYAKSGSFGDFVIDGLYAKSSHTESHGCKWGDGLYRSWTEEREAEVSASGFKEIDYYGTSSIGVGFNTNVGYYSNPESTGEKFSFYAESGMIGGMRPAMRVVSEAGSNGTPNRVYNADHTVVVWTMESTHLELPTDPKEGHEIVIINPMSAPFVVYGTASKPIFDADKGRDNSQWTFDGSKVVKVTLIYSAELNLWILKAE